MWRCHIGDVWAKGAASEGDTPLEALEATKAKTKCRTRIQLLRWYKSGQYVYPDVATAQHFKTLKAAREWAKGQNQ